MSYRLATCWHCKQAIHPLETAHPANCPSRLYRDILAPAPVRSTLR